MADGLIMMKKLEGLITRGEEGDNGGEFTTIILG